MTNHGIIVIIMNKNRDDSNRSIGIFSDTLNETLPRLVRGIFFVMPDCDWASVLQILCIFA